MKSWKVWLVPSLFGLAGVLFIFVAVLPALTDGLPVKNTFLVIGLAEMTLAFVFAAVAGRKLKGGAGPKV